MLVDKNKKIVILVCDNFDATVDISFSRPLDPQLQDEVYPIYIPTNQMGRYISSSSILSKIRNILSEYNIVNICFCRCTNEISLEILEIAKEHSIPTSVFWDDNLLKIPKTLGDEVYDFYSNPQRVNVMLRLIQETNTFISSTLPLHHEISNSYGCCDNKVLDIYRSITCEEETSLRLNKVNSKSINTFTIGYMGSKSHADDLKLIEKDILVLLHENEDIHFEIFGTIELPSSLLPFLNSQVFVHKKCDNYGLFMNKLSNLKWDVGLAPLRAYEFNSFKANTKWVEYTIANIPTFASMGPTYKSIIEGGMAEEISLDLADKIKSAMIDKSSLRELLTKSKKMLIDEYHISKHSRKVLDLLLGWK
ncbi:glycosyltransferase family 4 protein [Enterovibrio norvegicus]|uniref:glycosyltransferase family 4 protein n=1 Tax=Enterovibrio norvegicus TaxID=188144 RepID=UPI0010BF4E44|nr:glycosyltransferase family 4 protein [Enterovibrio norvegicus]TKF30067.1 glycosyltransferase family 4 protein [Enterovibrio norvegicus]